MLKTSLFPDLSFRAYWAFSAIAPVSRPVKEALASWHEALASEGMFAFGRAVEERRLLQAELSAFLGADAGRLVLTHGTTQGILALTQSLDWTQFGGRSLLLGTGEFPTNVIPWEAAARHHGLDIIYFDPQAFRDREAGLAAFQEVLDKNEVALSAFSAVGFQTGLRLPLKEISRRLHEKGALLAVDAIQQAGVVPLDLQAEGLDFAYGGGHKWMLGLDGVGWLYAKKGTEDLLKPLSVGWLSMEEPVDFLNQPDLLGRAKAFQPMPMALESGSSSSAAVFALRAGLKMLRDFGVEKGFQHVQKLHDFIEPELLQLGFLSERSKDAGGRSGTLSFRVREGFPLSGLQAQLQARGVGVTIPDGRLRLAPHFFTPEEEAEILLHEIRAYLA